MKENVDRYVSEVVLEGVRVFDMDAGRAEEQRFGHWLHEQVHGRPQADALFLEHAPSFDCLVQFARAERASINRRERIPLRGLGAKPPSEIAEAISRN